MPVVATMGAVGAFFSLWGANKQANAAEDAAKIQAAAAAQAAALQKPYRDAGLEALGKLQGMDPFQAPSAVTEQNDPGYQFRLQQAQQALERSAASRGTVMGGGTLKALARYSQDYASNEYGNVYGRAASEYDRTRGNLAQLAGMGAQATGIQGDYLTQGANAQAAGQVGGANAWNQALGNIGNNMSFLALANQVNKPQPGAPSWAGPGGSGGVTGQVNTGYGTWQPR